MTDISTQPTYVKAPLDEIQEEDPNNLSAEQKDTD